MSTHAKPKPTIVLACGLLLLTGQLCQTANAQEILNGSATLASATGPSLTVDYQVYDHSGVYEYDYTVINPAGDPGTVSSFSVAIFNSSAPGEVVSISGGVANDNNGSGVDWALFPPGVAANGNSGTLSIVSDDAPTFGNANANGSTPGPWASNPDGSQVPVPTPEPATTTLIALALLLPFRSKMQRITENR